MMAHPARTREGLWRQYRSLFEYAQVETLTGGRARGDDEGPSTPNRPILDAVMLCELREYMAPQLLREVWGYGAFVMSRTVLRKLHFIQLVVRSKRVPTAAGPSHLELVV